MRDTSLNFLFSNVLYIVSKKGKSEPLRLVFTSDGSRTRSRREPYALVKTARHKQRQKKKKRFLFLLLLLLLPSLVKTSL